jgi:hypothetical protein
LLIGRPVSSHNTINGGDVMRSRLIGLVLAMLVLTGVGSAEAAKRCRRLCRDQVQACVADARARIVCADRRGHERRDCQRELHAAIRTCKSMRGPILAACKTSPSVDTCSPSGAFVDDTDIRG